MSKKIKIISMLAVAAFTLAAVSPVFAQEGEPPEPGDGPRGGMLAEKLGLTMEEIQALRDSGMTMQEIFEQQGVEFNPWKGKVNGDLTEMLGLTAEEIQALRDSGLTIQEIFEQQGVEFTPRWGGGSGMRIEKLAEQCGLTSEELQSRIDAGETIKDICPDLERPERPERTGPRAQSDGE